MKTTYTYHLSQLWRSVVHTYGAKKAISFADGSVYSFSELDSLSTQFMVYLAKKHVTRGDVVAIFNEKSVLSFGLMLACIRSGVIYTNLDPASPLQRLDKMLHSCAPKCIFFDPAIQDMTALSVVLEQYACVHLGQLELPEVDVHSSAVEEPHTFHGDDALYIMFTSGSTGFPKGAVMSHANVLNFIQWGKQVLDVQQEDVFTNVNPIYFDNSVFDFYVSLFNGASLVPFQQNLVKRPVELVQAVQNMACTIWFSVPSMLVYLLTTKALTLNRFESIKKIVFGGEGFPKNKLKELYNLLGHRAQLFNVYGPTECTCICSLYQIQVSDFDNMQDLAPLGRLSTNFDYRILSEQPAQPMQGELCLIGPCVGLGYYNDTQRTAQSFIQNDQVSFHQRMYKTGDLVEQDQHGNLHFKGRVDNQIKHMGYRIELEEIEAAFNSLDQVDEVGVIYHRMSAELGQILAYVSVNESACTPEDLFNAVKPILPVYMLPRKILLLEQLPKNANGKIDRRQLKTLI